jgi:ribosomal protein S18 acetylase RimI-like enzyme
MGAGWDIIRQITKTSKAMIFYRCEALKPKIIPTHRGFEMPTVRKTTIADLEAIAEIHRRAFTRQAGSREWIECNFRAYPRIQYFIAEHEGQIAGFIEWMQKSGFRKDVVLELEQMAVDPAHQGKGVGRILIVESLSLVAQQLAERGAKLKHVIVTTRADNYAKRLYESSLNAKVEASISNLYSADEVLMIARDLQFKGNYLKPG